MSTFIHFTDEQKAQARQTDIVSLLISQGETVKRSGSEYEWKDGSQKVTVRGNLWFHQYERVGGDAIDFVRRFYNKSYLKAMEYLLGKCDGTLITAPTIVKEKKRFELPKPYCNMDRVKNYLHYARGIDEDIIEAFADENMIYESADYHNAVFVGYDKNGIPLHANKRGIGKKSTFKGNVESSQPEYSFHWNGKSNRLYLFESPIDMLSFISMNRDRWKQYSYAAGCCVSDRVMWQMLKDTPSISRIYLCLDNDEAGSLANSRISERLSQKGIESEILVPIHKDWNEDLIYLNEESEDEKQCQVLQL